MNIPALSSYTTADLEKAKARSPAVTRYLSLISLASPLLKRRYEAWLEAAIATLLNSAPPEAVTRHWSDAVDQILLSAWQEAGLDSLPVTLLALGKLGAQELNLSSDVDLVVVAAPSVVDAVATKLRVFHKRLTENTEHGWILRIDFDLRPGGRFGPVVATPGQLRDYYWSQGETWERLAWVRARSLAGSQAMAEEIFEAITPFCYRRFLDFTVMDDLKLLRRRVHSANTTPIQQIHLKLGQGGIRDLELYVHSLLIIHAGRRPDLRTHSTTQAIQRLQKADLLPAKDAQFILQAYWQLREWENTIQAEEDQQTHLLHLDQPAPLNQKQKEDCQKLCAQVDQLVSTLLGAVVADKNVWPEGDDAQGVWLKEHGISTEVANEVWPQLLSAVALSGKTERDELARRQFLGQFMDALKAHGLDADLGLATLLDFVRAIRAKATFFSLLLREPRLIRDLAHLFSVSPYLGQMISARPELLDAFLSQRTLPADGEWDRFLEALLERRQLSELLAAGQFLNSRDGQRFGQDLSETADQICNDLVIRLKLELGAQDLQLLPLGKWGGRELGLRSDLDFIMLIDHSPTENDHRVARRLITRLTENHRGGRLYAIDLRLRPTGHAGPLLINKQQLVEYLKYKAAAWERQSYLRARSADPELIRELRDAIFARGLTFEDQSELKLIREKLRTRACEESIDLKTEAGGLIEIEFTTQIAILSLNLKDAPANTSGAIEHLGSASSLWKQKGPALKKIYLQLRLFEQLQQLTGFHSGSKLEFESAEFKRLAQLMKLDLAALEDSIRSQLRAASALLQDLDPLSARR